MLFALLWLTESAVAARQADSYARTRQLHVVGYYQVPERVGDTALSSSGQRFAEKIGLTFPAPIALMVSPRTLLPSLSALPICDVFDRSTAPS